MGIEPTRRHDQYGPPQGAPEYGLEAPLNPRGIAILFQDQRELCKPFRTRRNAAEQGPHPCQEFHCCSPSMKQTVALCLSCDVVRSLINMRYPWPPTDTQSPRHPSRRVLVFFSHEPVSDGPDR